MNAVGLALAAVAVVASTSLVAEPVVYREAGPRPRVVLSKIVPVPGRIGPGPSLGRPVPPRDESAAFAVPTIDSAAQLAEAIVTAINRDRRARGLSVLRVSRPLGAAGDAHARALGLAGAFTHDWPLTPRASFGRWIDRFYPSRKRRSWSVGENLVWSSESLGAEEALTMWLNSPSHRRILVAPYWREIGVGVIRADNAGGVFAGRTVFIAAAEFGAR